MSRNNDKAYALKNQAYLGGGSGNKIAYKHRISGGYMFPELNIQGGWERGSTSAALSLLYQPFWILSSGIICRWKWASTGECTLRRMPQRSTPNCLEHKRLFEIKLGLNTFSGKMAYKVTKNAQTSFLERAEKQKRFEQVYSFHCKRQVFPLIYNFSFQMQV